MKRELKQGKCCAHVCNIKVAKFCMEQFADESRQSILEDHNTEPCSRDAFNACACSVSSLQSWLIVRARTTLIALQIQDAFGKDQSALP